MESTRSDFVKGLRLVAGQIDTIQPARKQPITSHRYGPQTHVFPESRTHLMNRQSPQNWPFSDSQPLHHVRFPRVFCLHSQRQKFYQIPTLRSSCCFLLPIKRCNTLHLETGNQKQSLSLFESVVICAYLDLKVLASLPTMIVFASELGPR